MLTDAALRNLKPKSKIYKAFDRDGMYVTVSPSGTVKRPDGRHCWAPEQKLVSDGYRCFVSGAKRENFDCTKTKGFLPTCLLRVQFQVDDQNAISHVRVAEPACIGTP